MENHRIAVLFDAENISEKAVPGTLGEIRTHGDVVLLRAYADWSLVSWRQVFKNIPMTAIQQFHDGTQAVDKALMMDVGGDGRHGRAKGRRGV